MAKVICSQVSVCPQWGTPGHWSMVSGLSSLVLSGGGVSPSPVSGTVTGPVTGPTRVGAGGGIQARTGSLSQDRRYPPPRENSK